jgi:hypothetical protein
VISAAHCQEINYYYMATTKGIEVIVSDQELKVPFLAAWF